MGGYSSVLRELEHVSLRDRESQQAFTCYIP